MFLNNLEEFFGRHMKRHCNILIHRRIIILLCVRCREKASVIYEYISSSSLKLKYLYKLAIPASISTASTLTLGCTFSATLEEVPVLIPAQASSSFQRHIL